MATRTIRGNDLTSRPVVVYDLDELRGDGCAATAAAQYLGSIRGFAELFQQFQVACDDAGSPREVDGEEDSIAQISQEILRNLVSLQTFRRKPSETDLAIIAAITIGQLYERLLFMVKHRDATRKGHRWIGLERLAQERGAEANKREKRRRIEDTARRLKGAIPVEQLATLPDTALARKLKGAGLGGGRSLRDHVAQARKQGLLPPRQEM